MIVSACLGIGDFMRLYGYLNLGEVSLQMEGASHLPHPNAYLCQDSRLFARMEASPHILAVPGC